MPDQNTTGASYLASLKKPAAASGPAATPAKASSAANGAVMHPYSEKRRSPRYRCQGSTHLREISTGVSTWATFTDISLHGVYVEAMSSYNVGARLALTLEVNNFRVETRGEIRAIYPGLGMGVSFLFMSDDNRERLRELVNSLSRQSTILVPQPAPSFATIHGIDSSASPPDPRAALQAITDFFDQRHILSRDEFLRILKKSQSSSG
jgi:hypothetical protein